MRLSRGGVGVESLSSLGLTLGGVGSALPYSYLTCRVTRKSTVTRTEIERTSSHPQCSQAM